MILRLAGAWLGGLTGRATGIYEEGHPSSFPVALTGTLVILFLSQ